MARNGGVVVRHKDFEVTVVLLCPDGVHLNAIGLDLWTLGIKEGMEQTLRLWRDDHI